MTLQTKSKNPLKSTFKGYKMDKQDKKAHKQARNTRRNSRGQSSTKGTWYYWEL